MAAKAQAVKTASKPATVKTASKPKPVTVAGWVLTGAQPTTQYRPNSARALWWAAVQAALAKGAVPSAALYAAHTATPPSLPKLGKGAGAVEKPSGWYGYFSRQQLVTPKAVAIAAK